MDNHKFRWLNDCVLHSNKYHSLYYTDKGEYAEFKFNDHTVYMDVNTLDLMQSTKERLPAPIPVVPQCPLSKNRNLIALSLNVTHACQLRCDYCYLSHFYPEMASKMSFETAKKAIDKLFDWKAISETVDSNPKLNYKIGFFGGEPLLNFKLIKEVVKYVTSLSSQFKFSLTTNGVGVTSEIAGFLAKHNFSLILSVDGPKEIHNHHRKYANGKGSFDDVMRGLNYLKDAGVTKITFRGTFLPDQSDLLSRAKFLNELCDKGYGRSVSIEPACLTEGCTYVPDDIKFTSTMVKKMKQEYLEVAEWIAERLNNGQKARFHNIMVYVERLVLKKQYCTECGGSVGYMAVNPEGKIFSCHREMSSEIGDLEKGGVDERLKAKWMDNRYYQISKCMKCKLRNVCGGPCREHNITATGDIHKNDPVMCNFYKNWIKAAVRVADKVPYDRLKMLYSNNKVKVQTGKHYSFVREAGGFGDIISMGGAATQLKLEQPGSEIAFCIPNDFTDIADHLKGIDQIVGLGSVEQLSRCRRSRNEEFDSEKYKYLMNVPFQDNIVDLWGPAYKYEVEAEKPLEFTRSQIFAKEAVCKQVDNAVPVWITTPDEKKFASDYLENVKSKGAVIGIAPRGTDSNRSLPTELLIKLVSWLKKCNHDVIYFDCVIPSKELDVHFPQTNFCKSVAIAEQCDVLITVDSSFLHVGAALGLPVLGISTMNDITPYTDLYSNLVVVKNNDPIGNCKMPCNRSKQKGYSEKCKDICSRKQNLKFDDVVVGVAKVLRVAFHPGFQEFRKKRILK